MPQQRYEDTLKAKVAEILAADEKHQKWLAEKPAKDKLFRDAMSYIDSVHHSYWTIKNLSSVGTVEPRKGCASCKDSYDEYMSKAHENRLKPRLDELKRQRMLLDGVHQRFMDKIRQRKPPTPLIFRGGTEPPP